MNQSIVPIRVENDLKISICGHFHFRFLFHTTSSETKTLRLDLMIEWKEVFLVWNVFQNREAPFTMNEKFTTSLCNNDLVFDAWPKRTLHF